MYFNECVDKACVHGDTKARTTQFCHENDEENTFSIFYGVSSRTKAWPRKIFREQIGSVGEFFYVFFAPALGQYFCRMQCYPMYAYKYYCYTDI